MIGQSCLITNYLCLITNHLYLITNHLYLIALYHNFKYKFSKIKTLDYIYKLKCANFESALTFNLMPTIFFHLKVVNSDNFSRF